MRKAKFAMVQLNSKIGDVAANISKVKSYIEDAASQGADMVLFPELCTSGYNTDYLLEHGAELAITADSHYVKEVAECAKKNNIYASLGAIVSRKNATTDDYYIGGGNVSTFVIICTQCATCTLRKRLRTPRNGAVCSKRLEVRSHASDMVR